MFSLFLPTWSRTATILPTDFMKERKEKREEEERA